LFLNNSSLDKAMIAGFVFIQVLLVNLSAFALLKSGNCTASTQRLACSFAGPAE